MALRQEEIDGEKVLVMYLNDDHESVEPEEATLLKIDWPDGRTTYATQDAA